MKVIYFIYLISSIFIVYYIYYANLNRINPTIKDKSEEFTDDDFDIYVINLVSNKHRLYNFTYEYNKSDLSFKKFNVFPAIVGKELDLTKHVTTDAY